MVQPFDAVQLQAEPVGVMHENSLQAYRQERKKFSEREMLVLAWLDMHGPATDRQVMRGLKFSEPNAVRPRITELVDAGLLVEIRSVRCPETGKTVRVVGRPPRQMELIAA